MIRVSHDRSERLTYIHHLVAGLQRQISKSTYSKKEEFAGFRSSLDSEMKWIEGLGVRTRVHRGGVITGGNHLEDRGENRHSSSVFALCRPSETYPSPISEETDGGWSYLEYTEDTCKNNPKVVHHHKKFRKIWAVPREVVYATCPQITLSACWPISHKYTFASITKRSGERTGVLPCRAAVIEDEVHMECTGSIVIHKLSSWVKKRLSVIERSLKKAMLPSIDTPL